MRDMMVNKSVLAGAIVVGILGGALTGWVLGIVIGPLGFLVAGVLWTRWAYNRQIKKTA
jgi:fucose permease